MTDEKRRAIEWECTRLINLYANLNDQARWRKSRRSTPRTGR
ncbi:MAG: hypothetical protein WDN24_17610 [Sphingomonas sp.]